MRKCRGGRRGNKGWFFCSGCLVWRVWWWDGRAKMNQHWAWCCVEGKKTSDLGVRK